MLCFGERVNGLQERISTLKYLSGVSIKVLFDYLHKFWGQNFSKEGRSVKPAIFLNKVRS